MANTNYNARYIFTHQPPINRSLRTKKRLPHRATRGSLLIFVWKYLVEELPDGVRTDKWFTSEELDAYEEEKWRLYQAEVNGPYAAYLEAMRIFNEHNLEFVFTPMVEHIDLTVSPPISYLMPRGRVMCYVCGLNMTEPNELYCNDCVFLV